MRRHGVLSANAAAVTRRVWLCRAGGFVLSGPGLGAVGLAPLPVQAGQRAFSRRASGPDRTFAYRLPGADGRTVTIEFTLPKHRIRRGYAAVSKPDDPGLKAELAAAFQQERDRQSDRVRRAFLDQVAAFRQALPDGYRFEAAFENGAGRWSLSYPGRVAATDLARVQRQQAALMHRFRGRYDRMMAAHLDERSAVLQRAFRVRSRRIRRRHYHAAAVAPDGTRIVRPDYAGLVADFADDLIPVADSLKTAAYGLDPAATPRRVLALALRFFQAIPYDGLTARAFSGRFGVIAPPALFDLNRGDCDTKSVALAATLRSLLPQRRTVMVLLPGHALLGIDIAPADGDRTLHWGGRRFVLLEPAGPGLYPVGRIADASAVLLSDPDRTVLPVSGPETFGPVTVRP